MKTDNELIAEFMGLSPNLIGNIGSRKNWSGVYNWNYPNIKLGTSSYEGDFATSWDWLMPVVESIQETKVKKGGVVRTGADVYIYYKACKIEYSGDEESGDDRGEWEIHTQGETKIEAVYKAVVEFIKWFNLQSK